MAEPVRVYRVRDPGVAAKSPAVPGSSPPPLSDKPSVAVLPFANMSTGKYRTRQEDRPAHLIGATTEA